LTSHIRKAVASVQPFSVRLQGITGQEGEYLFLNVKHCNDRIIELHDRLYSGPLATFYRAEFTYVPHLTVGRLPNSDAFRAALEEAQRITAAFEAYVDEITVYRIQPDEGRLVEGAIHL
jgi:2'-5' RNA ligase